jgi:2'-5' RNA ligase
VRLFVAAEIGDTLAAGAGDISRELQQRAAAAAPRAKITWVPSERLHLTIRFIGEIDDANAAAVCKALDRPIPVVPFDLGLAGAGAFPKSGSPRVLWIAVTDGREELVAIEREVTLRLAPLGVPEEDRAYSPHLTLARVREPAGLRTATLLNGLTDRQVGTVRIDAITLFHSKLSPKGPAYTPLLRVALGEGGSKDLPLH